MLPLTRCLRITLAVLRTDATPGHVYRLYPCLCPEILSYTSGKHLALYTSRRGACLDPVLHARDVTPSADLLARSAVNRRRKYHRV